MRIYLVRRAPNDVSAPAVGLPPGNSRSIMFVGVSDSAIVLFLKIVFRQIRIAAAPQPELLDKLFALFASAQLQKRSPLRRRNDVHHIFAQPLLVLGIQLFQGSAP